MSGLWPGPVTRTALERITWTRRGAHPLGIGTIWTSDTGCIAILEDRDGWHISVSHPSRYPTWDELAGIRDAATPPDIPLVMHFPPTDEYVNVHTTCLHLWEDKS